MGYSKKRLSVRSVLTYYLAVVLIVLFASNFIRRPNRFPDKITMAGFLGEKAEALKKDSSNFDLVFLGDSKTYCGFHPSEIDKNLGTRSANLSHWQSGLAVQYAALQDILPHLSKNTTVVYSIGHINFVPEEASVKIVYPIWPSTLINLMRMGFSWSELAKNVLWSASRYTNAAYIPGFVVYAHRQSILTRIASFLELPPSTPANIPEGFTTFELHSIPVPKLPKGFYSDSDKQSSIEAAKKIEAALAHDTRALFVDRIVKDGIATSIGVRGSRGGYWHIIIRSDYFERIKKLRVEKITRPIPESSKYVAERYLVLLDEIISLFQKHGVRLVINELNESPMSYKFEQDKVYLESVMKTVRKMVESRGVPYIRVNPELLSDTDYFDHNHFTRKGAQKYGALFAQEYRKVIDKTTKDAF